MTACMTAVTAYLVGGVVHALRVVILRHRRSQGHSVIVRDLQQQNILFLALEIGTLLGKPSKK